MNPTLALANAGCGKTFLLANVLIRLLAERLQRGEKPDPTMTLAVTFTRAAAAEMSQRLLEHLAEGTICDKARKKFSKQAGELTSGTYAALLAAVTQDLPRLQLGTIDSLIGRIARAFPAECGLPDGWEYVDEGEIPGIVRRCVIEWAVAEPSSFRSALADLNEGRNPAQPLNAMLKLVGGAPAFGSRASSGALSEYWQAPDVRAWTWMEHCSLQQICPKAQLLTADELAEWIAKFARGSLPTTAKGAVDGRWQKGHLSATESLSAVVPDWEALATDGLIQKVGETGQYYKPSTPDLLPACRALFSHALARAVEPLVRRGRARYRALSEIANRLSAQQFAEGLYTFSDITRSVVRAFHSGDWHLDQMHYRLDSQIRDMALDEFQDTSAEQFGILRPLIDEILDGKGAHDSRGLLVVTDPKQSIYGWRGGRPDLINKLQGMDSIELAESYRSAPAICSFVNLVFTGQTAPGLSAGDACGEHLARIVRERNWDSAAEGMSEALNQCGLEAGAEHDSGPLARGVAQWSKHFRKHTSAHPKLGGLVRVQRIDEKAEIASAVVDLVKERLARRPGKSIGLLLRDNRTLADCVAALRNAGIPVSDEGQSQLEDSPAVLALLSLLRLADHPGDRVSLFLATRKPLADILGVQQMELVDTLKLADDLATRIRREVADEGLAEWLGRMSELLEPHCTARDINRLEQLCMAAGDAAPSNRPDEFVRSLANKRTAAASTDLVRALTLHGSKGLEFDEVILPLYDSGSGRGERPWNLLRTSCVKPVVAVAPQPKEALLRHLPVLRAMANERELAYWLDDISGLYVGLTRPRTALHVLLSDTSDQPKSWSNASFMRFALPEVATALATSGAWECRDGELDGELPLATTTAATTAAVIKPTPSPTLRADPPVEVGSSDGVAHAWAKWHAQPTPDADAQALERGTLVHAALQRVKWAEDGAPTDTDGLLEQPLAGGGASWHALSRERTAALAPPGAELQVRTEVPILLGTDQSDPGRIDRLVIATKAGRPVWARVIDFKTGEVPPEAEGNVSLPAYRDQVRGYMAAVAAALRLESSQVTGALLFMDTDQLVEVTAA